MRTDKKEANYWKALSDIEDIISLIKSQPVMPEKPINSSPYFTCNVSKDEFCLMVNKAKEYIKEGEIYQAVLSRRFETEHEHSLLNAYRVLRTTNPSPYMVFMQNGDIQLMSASPETW